MKITVELDEHGLYDFEFERGIADFKNVSDFISKVKVYLKKVYADECALQNEMNEESCKFQESIHFPNEVDVVNVSVRQ